jgi:hypothetical protein
LKLQNNRIWIVAVSLFVLVFFLQVFSFIIFNELNGIHLGKRRARLSPPIKQSVAFQMKYETLEDISVEGQSSNTENPTLKFSGFFRRPVVESNAGSFFCLEEKISSSSTPPLFTLYRIFRI